MRFKTVGNKVDKAFIVIRNNTTTPLAIGAPCYFQLPATATTGIPGVDVQNANAAAGTGQNLFAGCVSESQQYGAGNTSLANGFYGEAQVYGFVQSLRLIRQTRATSTDSWPSSATVTTIDWLVPNTVSSGAYAAGATSPVYDAWSDIGTALTAVANSTQNSLTFPNLQQYAVLAQTLASAASSASSAINALANGSLIMANVVLVNAFLSAL